MRTRAAILFLLLFAAARSSRAVDIETPKNQPIEITSSGETRYENGIAIAQDNVAIHCGDADIYADSARYDSQRHEITADGHVRIYREGKLFLAEHGTYNLDTKEIHAHTVRIYENDRVVFQNVTFYIGKVPIFWWPYLYQSLNDAFSFSISPAYLS